LGVLVDRFIIGDPTPADAASAVIAPLAASEDSAPADEQVDNRQFPEVASMSSTVGLRDPFVLPSDIGSPEVPFAQTVAAPLDGDADGLTAEAFAQQYTLTAVFILGDGATAIVGDRTLEVGDTLDGATLLEVRGTAAVFRCIDGLAHLRLEDD
jgi:hypothetical protein